MSDSDYGASYAQRQIERSHSPIRKLIKGFYLRNLARDVIGPTIDFGCGAGQLLERLPAGSIGLEVNEYLVSALQKRGLNAQLYQPDVDKLSFNGIPEGQFNTFVMSHVLEHFDDAADGLRKILDSAKRLGIKRVIVVVPCRKGYSFDETHRTFVDQAYLEDSGLKKYAGYVAQSFSYFPIL